MVLYFEQDIDLSATPALSVAPPSQADPAPSAATGLTSNKSAASSPSFPQDIQIHISDEAIKGEGVGAVISGLKGVLMLANYTGAAVTMHDKTSGHGYPLSRYLRFSKVPGRLSEKSSLAERVVCKITGGADKLFARMTKECEQFDYSSLRDLGVFRNCNTVIPQRYLNHPRTCLHQTAELVRKFTRFDMPPAGTVKNDICVLRRGGDVETKILKGKGNMWAIDKKKTLPVLQALRRLGANITLVTETRQNVAKLGRLYSADVVSNKEPLRVVMTRLSRCRCLFVSGGSSFAAAVVQITDPTYAVYTESRLMFSFRGVAGYAYEEFGPRAVSVLSGREKLVRVCAPRIASDGL